MAEDTKPRSFNPDGVPLPPPTYNHVCITPLIPGSVDLITLAGLTGFHSSVSSNPTTVEGQAPIAYSKIKTCLASAGATPRDIVQVRHYIVKETGDPGIDKLDVVDRGWGNAWVSGVYYITIFKGIAWTRCADTFDISDQVHGWGSRRASATRYGCWSSFPGCDGSFIRVWGLGDCSEVIDE